MNHRSRWRCLVLVLALMLVALPVMAGERTAGRAGKSLFGELWTAVVRWVVPAGWWEKLGPGMDPDGTMGETLPGDLDHLGPEMDPNG
jgi:hypothetical protein